MMGIRSLLIYLYAIPSQSVTKPQLSLLLWIQMTRLMGLPS